MKLPHLTIDSTSVKRLIYRLRRDYLTLNNIVIATAGIIALSWIWGSIESMQRNYELQQLVDQKKYQVAVENLKTTLLEYESKYYQSDEYLDLAVRQRMNRASPGEKLLIVPSTDTAPAKPITATSEKQETSNFQQWMNFLFGVRRGSNGVVE
ncbi:MAG: hypothetical protein Q4F02_00240 [Candidatus Saccharibacteria bacterium]|nr:hypothetical protein [Candidatus Saccharibacteria bacterium]